jgi:hypothetical protein
LLGLLRKELIYFLNACITQPPIDR